MNLIYSQNVDSDEPVMLLNKHIGMDEENGMGIDGSLFQEELYYLDSLGKKRIQVVINSAGGVVLDGYNICNAILNTNTPVDTYCAGLAASIAGVIFQCGRKRIMADYGILMYHNPHTDSKKPSPVLESMTDSLNRIIGSKSQMDGEAVKTMMDRETFIGAMEAKELNLCDEIDSTVKLNTKYFPKKLSEATNYLRETNKILNKIFIKNKVMIKVTNKLNLNEDAKEESILDAINAIENRALEAEKTVNSSKEECDKLKNEMEEAENKYNKLKEEFEKNKAEMDALNKAKNDAEDAAKEEKAKNLVHDAVKAGRIKNEATVIAEWIADGKENFDKVKNRIEAIPVNKTAAKIVVNEAPKQAISSVAAEMAKISNKLK